jgi:hypothetical protein
MAVRIHENDTVLFFQLNNFLQLNNVTVKYSIQHTHV